VLSADKTKSFKCLTLNTDKLQVWVHQPSLIGCSRWHFY